MDLNPKPPKWAIRLLQRFIDPYLFPGLLGDLSEDFATKVSQRGTRKAKLSFILSSLSLIGQGGLRKKNSSRQHSNSTAMFKNYLTTSFRSFSRRKGYFALNIIGLSIGIAAFIAIQNYTNFEKSFDEFHANAKNIHRVFRFDEVNLQGAANSKPDLAPFLEEGYPEIINSTRFFVRRNATAQTEEDGQKDTFNDLNMLYADEKFLDVFSFPGSPASALAKPNTVVITEALSLKLFGYDNAIGAIISIKDPNFPLTRYTVTGILQNPPKNSHFHFDALLSLNTPLRNGRSLADFGWTGFYSYVQTREGTDIGQLKEKLDVFVENYFTNNENMTLDAQAITEIHLNSNLDFEIEKNGQASLVSYLSMTGFFILLMAYANYINFATAKSMDRAKEVGVRQVLGAVKGQLRIQFLVETALVNLFSVLLAIGLLALVRPQGMDLNLARLLSFQNNDSILLLAVLIVGSFLSGLYPAIILSGFKPVVVLRGKVISSKGGILLRRVLIVGQLSISLAMIIGTFVIRDQINYIIGSDKGFKIDDILIVDVPNIQGENSRSQLAVFREELLSLPFVSSVSTASTTPGQGYNYSTPARRLDQLPTENAAHYIDGIDENFIDHYELNLLEGKTFSAELSNKRDNIVINQASSELFGFASPQDAVNRKVIMENDTLTIIGVIANYNHKSLKQNFDPQVFQYYGSYVPHYSVKVEFNGTESQWSSALSRIEGGYNNVFPNSSIEYYFLEDSFNEQYSDDQKFADVSALFSFLSIAIAILGLIGLISFIVANKVKEIALRKIMGASKVSIIKGLVSNLLLFILIAGVIASLFSYLFLENWLNNYAFKIDLSIVHFVVPVVGIVLLTLVLVIVQSLGSVSQNPMKWINND